MNTNPPLQTLHLAKTLAACTLAAALAACGGGGGNADTAPEANGPGLTASRPGELAATVQGRLRALDAQGRLSSGDAMGGLSPTFAAALPAANAAPAARGANASSSTLLQEAGIDEANLIQTDGRTHYTLQPQSQGSGPKLAVYERATDGRAVALGQLSLPADGGQSFNTDGMVFSSDQRALAVISQQWTATPAADICPEVCTTIVPQWMRSSVTVQRVDVSNPAAAAAGERISIDGFLIDSRRIGDALYVVTQHRPVLAAQLLPTSASADERNAAITRLSAADLLPRMRRNGGAPEPLLADTDCYVQNANASGAVQFTTITVFDLRSATLARTSRCFVGGSEAIYMSSANLYVATTRWSYPGNGSALVYPAQIATDIHKFALGSSAGAVSYRGTGQVDGHLGWDREKKSFRLSEHNGDLRVLSFTGETGWATPADATASASATATASATSAPPSPARLTVLRERSSDQTLQAVATLPNNTRTAAIGKTGEQVYAVRFLGDRAYVVTFRRTDPLYVLDLSNPADPKTVGELEVAGFSEYLFPLANNLLLGVGRDADTTGRVTGLKVALFDVANPAMPTQRASVGLGTTGSNSALDFSRHGLNMRVAGDVARVALPAVLTGTPYANAVHGLQKLEVDTAARTMRLLPMVGQVGSTDNNVYSPLWLERSAQIGDTVYYLANGTLTGYSW